MASVIAMSGNPVRMTQNGWLMIHEPWGGAVGTSDELRQQADLLERIGEQLVDVYAAKSGQDRKAIAKMMEEETWLNAQQAHDLGFVDEITEPLDIAARVRTIPHDVFARFQRVPAAVADLTRSQGHMKDFHGSDATGVPAGAEGETAAPAVPVESPDDAPDTGAAAGEDAGSEGADAPSAPTEAAQAAIVARVGSVIAERDSLKVEAAELRQIRDALRAELTIAEAARVEAEDQRDKFKTALDRLETSLGVATAHVTPDLSPANSAAAADPVTRWLAAHERGDREEAAKIFAEHNAAIWAHRRKISQAGA
jgi:hypothetical protein